MNNRQQEDNDSDFKMLLCALAIVTLTIGCVASGLFYFSSIVIDYARPAVDVRGEDLTKADRIQPLGDPSETEADEVRSLRTIAEWRRAPKYEKEAAALRWLRTDDRFQSFRRATNSESGAASAIVMLVDRYISSDRASDSDRPIEIASQSILMVELLRNR